MILDLKGYIFVWMHIGWRHLFCSWTVLKVVFFCAGSLKGKSTAAALKESHVEIESSDSDGEGSNSLFSF